MPNSRASSTASDDGAPTAATSGTPAILDFCMSSKLAREFGITLVGFLKPDRFNVYSRPDRIL